MSHITIDHLAAAIRKIRSMNLQEKEALADEIHRRQPHMIASCLVQSRLGAEPAAVELLLNILLVCYQSMKESGLQWPLITEDEQERQMQRWTGAVQFSELAADSSAEKARAQYASEHSEQALLAFVVGETNRWLHEISRRNAQAESDKFVMMASMNLVNCIASASVSTAVHG